MFLLTNHAAAAAAKSLQLCLTLCNPINGSPPGSSVPGILQARILEWVVISFSNAWKWKVKSESEVAQSCLTSQRSHGPQLSRLLCPWDFPGKSTGVVCHCLLWYAEYIRRSTGLDEAQGEIKISRRNINNLRYGDDTTLMAESKEELKSLLVKVKEEMVKKLALNSTFRKLRSWHLVPSLHGK